MCNIEFQKKRSLCIKIKNSNAFIFATGWFIRLTFQTYLMIQSWNIYGKIQDCGRLNFFVLIHTFFYFVKIWKFKKENFLFRP